VAQSPPDKTASREYTVNWNALGAFIARGYSFSGRERNCAFLNTGKWDAGNVSRFACAAGAMNLDLQDDARAVIATDWDEDGDLDLWLMNRTAPRLRLLRNEQARAAFLSVKLQGVTCNRDAIGATASLTLRRTNGSERTLHRTVTAGDAFLSCASKTLHFNFAPDETPRVLTIRWPLPAGREEVHEPGANTRIVITEGRGAALLPARVSTTAPALPPVLPEPTSAARIPLESRARFPAIGAADPTGRPFPAPLLFNRRPNGTLIVCWSASCAVCQHELFTLAARRAELDAAGLNVLLLCLDSAKTGVTEAVATAQSLITTSGLTPLIDAGIIAAGMATADTVAALVNFEQRLLYPAGDIVTPTQWLVSPQGIASVLYKGPLGPGQLSKDSMLWKRNADDVQFPFPGKFARDFFKPTRVTMAQAYLENGDSGAARDEVNAVLEPAAGDVPPPEEVRFGALALLASIEEDAGRPAEALAALDKVVAASPVRFQPARATLLWKAGRRMEAAQLLESLAASDPLAAARAWKSLREPARAAAACRAALTQKPDDPAPAALLAWLLATAKDSDVRDIEAAEALADRAVGPSRRQTPELLSLAAAVVAARGDYQNAVAAVDKALRVIWPRGADEFVRLLRAQRAAYAAGTLWLE
jgi:ASPIC and UnbV